MNKLRSEFDQHSVTGSFIDAIEESHFLSFILASALMAEPAASYSDIAAIPNIHWRCQSRLALLTSQPPLDFIPVRSKDSASDWIELKSFDGRVLKLVYGPDNPAERMEWKINLDQMIPATISDKKTLLAWTSNDGGQHHRYAADLVYRTLVEISSKYGDDSPMMVATYQCREAK